MSLDFPCPNCGKLLRTPDDAVGKKARCPNCQEVATVPDPEWPAPEPPPADPTAAGGSPYLPPPAAAYDPNPYASPHAGFESSAAAAEGPLSGRAVRIDSPTIYRDTWAIFKNNLGQGALFTLAFLGITYGFVIIMQIVISVASLLGAGPAIAANVIMQIVNLFVGGYTSTVAVRFACNVTRGSPSPLNDAFSSFDYVIRLVLFNLLIVLPYIPITILAVVPFGVAQAIGGEPFTPVSIGTAIAIGVVGIILFFWLVWMQVLLAPFFIVDRDQGVLDAVKASARYMQGNKGNSFVMLLVTGLVGSLLCVCTCYLGILLMMPYIWILLGLIYLTATGQPYSLAGTPRDSPTRISLPPSS